MIARRRHLVLYGLPALPLAALGIPVHVHLPTFYAEDRGLGLAAVGAALLLARMVDVIADPVIGWLCDRGHARRKTWMAAGLPLLAGAGWLLFLPPPWVGVVSLALMSALFYLGMTLMLVPYQAWGAEWSADYTQRTRIAGWREGFGLAGIVLALALPALFALPRAHSLAALFPPALALLALAALAALLLLPEPPRPQAAPGSGWQVMGRNRAFRHLIAVQALNACANALPATLFLPFVGDRLGRPDLAGPLLLAYLLAGIASVPVWLAVSRRLGKHRAWALSLALAALAFLPVAMLGAGDWPWFALFCVLTGLGLGADLALPAAILADIAGRDGVGRGYAGLSVSLLNLTAKLALALAVGLAFPLLDRAGFTPGSGTAPLALPLLYAGLPVALKLAASLLILRFPQPGDLP